LKARDFATELIFFLEEFPTAMSEFRHYKPVGNRDARAAECR